MEDNRLPKKVLYMNLEATRLTGRSRNRWQDGLREDGRIVGGEVWQEKVHNREEWKKLLITARNRRILHMPPNRSVCEIILKKIYYRVGQTTDDTMAHTHYMPEA